MKASDRRRAKSNDAPRIEGGLDDFESDLKLVSQAANTDPARALKLARIMARKYQTAGRVWPHARFLFLCAQQCAYLDRMDEVERYMGRAGKLYRRLGDDRERGMFLTCLGACHLTRADLEEAYPTLSQAQSFLERAGDDGYLRGLCAHSLGFIFETMGDYHTALEHYIRARSIWEALGRSGSVAPCLAVMGRIYIRMLNVVKARKCYMEALALYRAIGDRGGLGVTLVLIGQLQIEAGQPARSLEHLREACDIFDGMGMRRQRCEALASLSQAYRLLKNHGEALRCIEMSLDLIDTGEERNNGSVAAILINRAAAHVDAGEIAQGRPYAERALALAETAGDPLLIADAHRMLAGILEALGDSAGALGHFKRHMELRDTVFGVVRMQEIAEIEMRYGMAEAMKEREQLEHRARSAEEEAQRKSNKLNVLAVKIMQHNEALKRLREVMQKGARSIGAEAEQLTSFVLKNAENEFEGREGWRGFEEEFERVHEEFIRRLRRRCDQLTPTEVRICVLTRLGLANKQIADGLFISPMTVKTHRRNIRRKLGLEGSNLRSQLLLI